MSALGITIAREPLAHRLYHFRLAFSGFEHERRARGASENQTAISATISATIRIVLRAERIAMILTSHSTAALHSDRLHRLTQIDAPYSADLVTEA